MHTRIFVRRVQIRDLDKGTFGFVQLAVDLTTGDQVAIKFIERSQEVNCLTSHLGCVLSRLREGVDSTQLQIARHAFTIAETLSMRIPAGVQICGARDPQSQEAYTPTHCAAQGGELSSSVCP